MSVIKAAVAISIFVTILASNTANGENEPSSFYNNQNPSDQISEDNPPAYGSDASIQHNSKIPLNFLLQVSKISNIQEFLEKFVDPHNLDPQDNIGNRFGAEDIERSKFKVATPAECIPAQTVVPLPPLNPSKNTSVYYFPECTRVNRCGGCCPPLASCQPIETETLSIGILKVLHRNGLEKILNKEIVLVEQHTKCGCKCKKKKEDCNFKQVYNETECSCNCNSIVEQNECQEQYDKIWDKDNCSCECANFLGCTSGTVLNKTTCKCVKLIEEEVNSANSSSRKRFVVKAIPDDSNSNTQYITDV